MEDQQVQQLTKTMDRIWNKLDGFSEEFSKLTATVDRLDAGFRGGGKGDIGLFARVAALESKVNNVVMDVRGISEEIERAKAFIAVLITLFLFLAAGVVYLFVHL